MGQRLIVSIKSGGERVANCYYHWSAYTCSALSIAEEIIKFIDENKIKSADASLAIKMFQSTGAELEESEVSFCRENSIEYTNVKKIRNRSDGLISVSEKEMSFSQNWAEGNVKIDVDNRIILFDVFWDYLESDDYETTETADDIPIDDIGKIKFKDVSKALKYICEIKNSEGLFKVGKTIYGVIS